MKNLILFTLVLTMALAHGGSTPIQTLVIPSPNGTQEVQPGATITIDAGASIINHGTATGFSSGTGTVTLTGSVTGTGTSTINTKFAGGTTGTGSVTLNTNPVFQGTPSGTTTNCNWNWFDDGGTFSLQLHGQSNASEGIDIFEESNSRHWFVGITSFQDAITIQDVNGSANFTFDQNGTLGATDFQTNNGSNSFNSLFNGSGGSVNFANFASSAGSAPAAGGSADYASNAGNASTADSPSNASNFGGFDLTGNSSFSISGTWTFNTNTEWGSALHSLYDSFAINFGTDSFTLGDASTNIDFSNEANLKATLGPVLASVHSLTGTLSVTGTANVTVPSGIVPWVQDTNSSVTNVGELIVTVSGTIAHVKSTNSSDTSTFTLFYWQ